MRLTVSHDHIYQAGDMLNTVLAHRAAHVSMSPYASVGSHGSRLQDVHHVEIIEGPRKDLGTGKVMPSAFVDAPMTLATEMPCVE